MSEDLLSVDNDAFSISDLEASIFDLEVSCKDIGDMNSTVNVVDNIESLSTAIDTVTIGSIGGHTLQTFSLCSIGAESGSASKNERNNKYNEGQLHSVHEGVFTKIYCLRDPENKFGTRTGFVAIKALYDEFSGPDKVSRLQNEYRVSRHLSQCSAVRSALVQHEVNGVPAIFLEWVNGISLVEWISSLRKKKSSSPSSFLSMTDIKIALHLARNITDALANLHDAGVIHNNLTTENIIVDNNNDSGDLFVKLIGLGSSYLQKDRNNEKIKDLISLGSVFFEMLTGHCPFHKNQDGDTDAGERKEDEPIKTFFSQNQLVCNLTARVPLQIAKFILNLMEVERSNITPIYQSAKEVDKKLFLMIGDLQSFMSSSVITQTATLGQLNIPKGKLYGRDYHVSKLMDACSRIGTSGESKMVLISGYSGAGKSTIVRHVKRNFDEISNIHFICGKFDSLQQAKPLSAMNAALTEYSNSIVKKDLNTINQIKRAIFDVINADIGVLTEAFPCLCKIVGEPTTIPTEVDSMAALNRFKSIFRLFFRAIATPSHPIILFLDDLQWADELSLQLVGALVSDTEMNGLLFVGCCRDNEVDAAHPLASLRNELESKKIAITNINVASIPKEDVNVMISDSICTPQQWTKSLSDIVYRKTSGNALFVAQFLQSLWDEDLLLFSLESNTWQWSAEAIDAKNVADDVGVLMSAKILQLPFECQYALKLFACAGSKCDEATLRLFMGEGKGVGGKLTCRKRQRSTVESDHEFPMIDFATNEGLLKKEGSVYMFAHDQIQHAAYSLIPENERGHLHKHIGYLILRHVPDNEVDDVLFIAVDQLNRGRTFVKEEDKRVELAKLNLRAAEKAMLSATFLSSASYLDAGIGLLSDSHWVKYYELSLQLYSLYTEAEYCLGHFQEVGRVAGIIIKEARFFRDKLRVYATLIKALSAQTKIQEAIEMGFNVLEKLGVQCQYPRPDKAVIMRELMTMKKVFENMTDAEFLNLKEMNDTNMITAMKFLYLLILAAYLGKQEYFPIIITQMMKLTLEYGVCKESCPALAACSFLLVNLKDFEGADHIGHFAFLLFEKLKAEEYLPVLHVCVYGGVLSWIRHTKNSLAPLKHGYKVGMQNGDILYAMVNISRYINHSFASEQNLKELSREIEVFGRQMIEYKQISMYETILPLKRAVTDLISPADNPSLFFFQSTESNTMLANFLGEKKYLTVCDFYICGSIVAYTFGEYALASELVQKRRELEKLLLRSNAMCGLSDFFDGLIFLAMAHTSTDGAHWISLAGNAILNLENFARICKPNFESKLLLLQAETKNIMGEKEGALEKYELAITAAENSSRLFEQAIASERLADFLLKTGDSRVSHYYGKAHSLYHQWGAQRKADHLIKNIPF